MVANKKKKTVAKKAAPAKKVAAAKAAPVKAVARPVAKPVAAPKARKQPRPAFVERFISYAQENPGTALVGGVAVLLAVMLIFG